MKLHRNQRNIRLFMGGIPALSVALLLGSSLAVPVTANADLGPAAEVAGGVIAGVLFNEAEKRLLGDYLRDGHYRDDDYDHGKKSKEKKLPPGLRMKLERGGELPPGWQKKVARGEVLDAELYSYSHSLPEEILRRMPRRLDGTSLRRIDDRIVRVMDATQTVLDVFYLTNGQY